MKLFASYARLQPCSDSQCTGPPGRSRFCPWVKVRKAPSQRPCPQLVGQAWHRQQHGTWLPSGRLQLGTSTGAKLWQPSRSASLSAGVGEQQQDGGEQERDPQHTQQQGAFAHTTTASSAASSTSSSGSSNGAQSQPEASVQVATADLQWADVWRLLQPDWRMLAACCAVTMVSVVCSVMVAPTLGKVIDVISRGTLASRRELGVAVATLAGVYIGSNVTLTAQVALSLSIAESLAARLRSQLFLRLLGRDALFFDRVKTGQMISWLGQDVEVLQSTLAKLLGARGVRSAFETVGIIAVLFTLSPVLAATLLVSAPLLTPLIAKLTKRIGGASKAAQAAADDVASAADEIIENIKVVKLFGAEGREVGRFQGLVEQAHQLSTAVIGLQGLLDISSRARNTMCILSTLSLGTWLALTGRVTIGTCYSFFIFAFSFAFSLGNLANTSGDVAKAAGAMARALAAMKQAQGEEEGAQPQGSAGAVAGAVPADAAAAASSSSSQQVQIPPDQFRGAIEFKNVSFRHPGWEGWTLSDISFSVPAGSTVALVGPSGGGKSTLASLVMGLYAPEQGTILVDGIPMNQLDLHWWRCQLGVVMQDAGLMSGRVRDIIAYGRPSADQAEMEAAARTAQAHAFITGLPQGYDTIIGPAGVELSGGQQQRLAIARALLVQPKVLLFDEATSALDVETEGAVSEKLHEAGRETTTLVIAHRLSTVRRADSIVVVAKGQVVEVGTHEQLLQHPEGVYRRLVSKAERRGQDSWESDKGGASSASEGESDGEAEGTGQVAEFTPARSSP